MLTNALFLPEFIEAMPSNKVMKEVSSNSNMSMQMPFYRIYKTVTDSIVTLRSVSLLHGHTLTPSVECAGVFMNESVECAGVFMDGLREMTQSICDKERGTIPIKSSQTY